MSIEGEFAVHGGLDEAGYGPMLGPLTFGYSAFRTTRNGEAGTWSPSWERLSEGVSVSPKDDGKRLVVADSKKVFTRNPRGSRRLELTALAFLGAAGHRVASGQELVACAPPELAPTAHELGPHPWYTALSPRVPMHATSEMLEERQGCLRAALAESSTEVVAAGPVVIPSGKLNRSFEATGNKGATLWSFNSEILTHLWDRFAGDGLHMTVDRLGGRARYGRLLSELIPFSEVRVLSESRIESRYLVTAPHGRMGIRFVQKGDTLSLPVALGSCIAKYARELVMDAFNEHFDALCPGVTPTAGYVTDARRWLKDIEARDPGLLTHRDSLIRTR